MILTRAPVEEESSVTEYPAVFATQMSAPSEVTLEGSSNPYLGPLMTLTRAPVEAESSVTELENSFVTQICVPPELIP